MYKFEGVLKVVLGDIGDECTISIILLDEIFFIFELFVIDDALRPDSANGVEKWIFPPLFYYLNTYLREWFKHQ